MRAITFRTSDGSVFTDARNDGSTQNYFRDLIKDHPYLESIIDAVKLTLADQANHRSKAEDREYRVAIGDYMKRSYEDDEEASSGFAYHIGMVRKRPKYQIIKY